jgi:benzoyl-CoA 2,3-dioxygenase component B
VANYYTAGLKGRWMEERRKDDHRLTGDSIMVDTLADGEIGQAEVAALVGLNTDLRREYIADCQNGVTRWNKILDSAGLPQRLRLPHVAFNRKVGAFAGIEASPDGEQLTPDQWQQRKGAWRSTNAARSRRGSRRRATASTASRSTTTSSTSPSGHRLLNHAGKARARTG